MSDFWKYLNNKVKKPEDVTNEKKSDYSGEVGYVADSYLIGKKTHSNVSIDECINYAKNNTGGPSTYFGYNNSGNQTKCWVPEKDEYSFDNQTVNKPKKTKSSHMAMYFTPTGDISSCKNNKNCIKQFELSKIEKLKKQYSDQVVTAQKKAAELALTKKALDKGITFDEAKQQQQIEQQSKKAYDSMNDSLK